MRGGKVWVNTAEIKRRVQQHHGSTIQVTSDFTGWRQPLGFHCTECELDWQAPPQNVSSGVQGCPSCGRRKSGANISAAIRSSARFKEDLSSKIATLVSHPSIGCTNAETLEHRLSPCDRYCYDCYHVWTESLFRALKNVGCPECTRLETNANKLGSLARFNERLAALTGGRTSAREWHGRACARTYDCTCGTSWTVAAGESANAKIFCPSCKVRTHSLIAAEWLDEEAKRRRTHIQHGRNGGEYRIPGTRMKVDGYCARTNTVFEFHGDIYHGNPKLFAPHERCHPFRRYLTAGELYKRTCAREQHLRELGYTVVTMWEHDYRQHLLNGGSG